MSHNQVIANEIIKQLGGFNKVNTMVGLKDVLAVTNGVSFKIKVAAKANFCKITLNQYDTYDIVFMKIRGFESKTIAEVSDVYCDQLKKTIEKEMGVYLSL